MTAVQEPFVGRRVRRVEDPRLLRGEGLFVDDDRVPRMVHAAFVRSPVASARIDAVDLSAARSSPGVLAVYTAGDLAQGCTSWSGLLNWPGMVAGEQTALATGVVRHVGEPVALVVARSRALAEDACGKVVVDYEGLIPVVDPHRALEPGSALVHQPLGTNLAFAAEFGAGDVDPVFSTAPHVVEVTMSTGRHTATAMEPRGILADGSARDRTLTVRVSTQAAHMLQTTYARILGLPENGVRVLTTDVGGAFGMKAHVYPDEVAVCAASLLLGRPVKWIQDRSESLQSDTAARDEQVVASLALDDDGTMLGLRADVLSDGGAFSVYPRSMVTEAIQIAIILPGPYRIPCYRGAVRVAITNKAPLAVYRAVGHPVAILVMESLVDAAARRLGLEPAELRRRNLLTTQELPHRSLTGQEYDSGSYLACLDTLTARLDTWGLEERRAEAATRGRLLGVGIANFVELTAPGSQFYGARGAPITAHDQVEVRIEPDGTVVVLLGTASQGQGLHTTAAQVVADHLSVPMDQIRVLSGDTMTVPHGTGVWGSRSAVVSGAAAANGAATLKKRLLEIAGHLLEVSVGDLVMQAGHVSVLGSPTESLTLKQIAEIAHWKTYELPDEVPVSLSVIGEARGPKATFNNGAHAAIVEVDPGLGLVEVVGYEVVEDCGTLINPQIVDEQIRGGIAQGLGGALFEKLHYDEDGQLLTTTLLDYHLPTSGDVPDITISHVETPSPLTPLGTKGAGEAGTAGAPAAIHNAVNDALAQIGASVWQQPLTPERILDAVRSAQSARSTA